MLPLPLFYSITKHARFQPPPDGLVWATKAMGIFANQSFTKHQLKLFPFGALTFAKDNDKKSWAKNPAVIRVHTSTGPLTDHLLQVSSPKLDVEKLQGLAIPFWAVQPIEAGSDSINMEVHVHKEEGISIPFLRNSKKLSRGDQLQMAKPEESSQTGKDWLL